MDLGHHCGMPRRHDLHLDTELQMTTQDMIDAFVEGLDRFICTWDGWQERFEQSGHGPSKDEMEPVITEFSALCRSVGIGMSVSGPDDGFRLSFSGNYTLLEEALSRLPRFRELRNR